VRLERYVYKHAGRTALKLSVHFPTGWRAADRRGAMVFFFGGAWRTGTMQQFRPQAEYLARRGLVGVRADYRVRERHGVRPDACVEDAKSAVRWLRANARRLGVDPQRIVAAGGSAGGHIAACAAILNGFEADGEDLSVSSSPNLLVLFNPVLTTTTPRVVAVVGSRGLARAICPNAHLAAGAPPAILFYGTQDRFLAHGRRFIRRARELGNAAELYAAAGAGHGFFNRSPWRQVTLDLADRFLGRHGYLAGEPEVRVPSPLRMSQAGTAP